MDQPATSIIVSGASPTCGVQSGSELIFGVSARARQGCSALQRRSRVWRTGREVLTQGRGRFPPASLTATKVNESEVIAAAKTMVLTSEQSR